MSRGAFIALVAALIVPAASSSAQSADPLEAIQQRLDALAEIFFEPDPKRFSASVDS